jgi:tRNA A-37 threonylcarbamoyl transferase component Bud32
MNSVKDTRQAQVRIGYDGRVHKTYYGPLAQERFENECRVLRYLERKGCPFVPRVIEADAERRHLVTSNCGKVVDKISKDKVVRLFAELEQFGVRHNDAFARNITYSPQLGRFCLIDFELATILETGEGLTLEEVKRARTSFERTRERE